MPSTTHRPQSADQAVNAIANQLPADDHHPASGRSSADRRTVAMRAGRR